ncbi:acetyl/propionyl-CoA carboxylase subunit alpha [Micrococcus luteus]|uniref:acetyl/propionyl/methylcrotonyl-CoA carboxylase subunit alpha n=1 Tax=Micrococcus TaxID=1269 RepID=UPI00098F4485|nr:biotin carboxylase N-terminal domain-containing protein [Micrococcus sp. KBS0714]MCT1870693.1 acetyl/propionyl-CoA carboxylase subunit alpha [Micrococcus luteus]MCV7496549.1 acetyl/propionyl-CoA carboxylase subunit alpha [Micrococcus luteus]MCV7614933.1 acetyl/propionyl-CoA carboxylase subunit alpha [Micrococcus luteus]MCV7724528.1 acetyl/propionyl-CoA carboxylase subunit alpha [Micrococcus luteus]MCV7739366.1 acetyl/propionyl-CoA carboxylase subunit alpha [Micrococcus luteus]
MTENHAQGTPLFDTVLLANRGEIAVRVIRTLRRLGIRSVAVHSDADADARHVREADTAVRLGPAPARESYLDIDAVVDAARRTGAQAVHPGYGFLSENADFARALEAAGIVFVGPPVGSLDAMADKIRAKETVAAYDVPVVPGIQDPTLTDAQITAEAEHVGFPLLIKPSAGGGGKGMVAVRAAEELPGALASARRTARSAFGDDTLLLERLITAPRHVEVQVFADAHGATVHLGERECSLQRRHQKVIEEAPAPLLTGLAHGAELRERLGRAAVDAAVSVGYRGAGTVEFLVSDENPDEFFFMEMNTRLQVEHPVSEEVVRVRGQRLDFVELQLRIAAGEPLGFAQEDVSLDGAAVEARVYAEDPANGFLPSTGPVLRWREPAGEGVRVDTLLLPSQGEERAFGTVLTIRDDEGALWEGLAAPDGAQPEITGFYDPMIAKLITRGADRTEALERLDAALADTVLFGVRSNLGWLRELAARTDVRTGRLTTELIDGLEAWTAPALPEDLAALAAEALADVSEDAAAAEQRAAGTAWARADGWRGAGAPQPGMRVRVGDEDRILTAPAADAEVDEDAGALAGVNLLAGDPRDPRSAWLHRDGAAWQVRRLTRAEVVEAARAAAAARRAPAGAASPEARTPMPGTVVAVSVATGDTVAAGQELAVVEAMKMEHPVTAAVAGVVTVHVAEGDPVAAQALIAVVEPAENAAPEENA